jgi:hypothetical protein
MSIDKFALRSITQNLGAAIHVRCKAGIADIVTEDEVIETDTIDEWKSTMERAKSFANCLNRRSAIILTGMGSVNEVDAIDDACEEQGVELYLYNGITLTNIADHWLTSSRDKAMRVAETIAARYGIGARSNDLLKYEREMIEVLAEIDLSPDPPN